MTHPPQHQPSDETSGQHLTFAVGSEVFAADIRTVPEIIQHSAMTSVPLMPSFVRGAINLRGTVVPVIDPSFQFRSRAGADRQEELHCDLRRTARR